MVGHVPYPRLGARPGHVRGTSGEYQGSMVIEEAGEQASPVILEIPTESARAGSTEASTQRWPVSPTPSVAG